MKIAKALFEIGKRLGVSYKLLHSVKKISVSAEKKALGIFCDTDEIIEADAIVVNADLLYAYKELLPSYDTKPTITRRKEDISCSAITFYWSMSKKVPLESHNLFVGQTRGQEFLDVYWSRTRPSKPSFYVHVPSRTDLSAAPEGKDTVMVLILVDNNDISKKHEANAHEELIADTREYILSCMATRTGVAGLRSLIEHESYHSPLDWQNLFNSDRGSAFGLNHNFFNILSFRPHIKHDVINGIYFVGASTHPGAGIPTCLAGAKITAERILSDLDVSISWECENFRHREHGFMNPTTPRFWQAWKQITLIAAIFFLVALCNYEL